MNLVVERAVRGIKLEEAFLLKIIDGFLGSINGSVVDIMHVSISTEGGQLRRPKALYAA